MDRYYRYQRIGLPVIGHTSVTSNDELLPDGYVFAYDSPEGIANGIAQWGLYDDPQALEVVIFDGDDAYDPGDAEGVAVQALTEIERVPLSIWLARHPES